jgi:hypothetical protein
MITEAILSVLMYPIQLLLEQLDTVNITIPANVFSTLEDVCSSAGYVLPMGMLSGIFVISIALSTFNLIWRLAVKIEELVR